MNDDFEKKLIALTGALRRPDPTAAWKGDILARARSEAQAIPFKRMLPPRVLMFAWAAAWAAIVLLSIATPRNLEQRPASDFAASGANQKQEAASGVTASTDLTASTATLIAFDRQYNLNGGLQ
jgi:hypothetical protein